MASELEITKRNLFTDSHSYSRKEKIALEDGYFMTFLNYLEETDIINTPVLSRSKDKYKNKDCGILGYCCSSYTQNLDNPDENQLHEDIENDPSTSNISDFLQWEYTLFNGFFSLKPEVTKATRQSINKSISEVTTFIEKTLSTNYINDFVEARNLQEHLVHIKNENILDRIDIYIVTDSIIEQDELLTNINIKGTDINCRIYYWDLKKLNDLKRSKAKRLPIDISFLENDYKDYHIDFIEKIATPTISYYLTIFPAKLISDIYDYNKTRVLENNVRVFLSTKRVANKAIRDTIKNDPSKFFSFNNGISATAESVTIEDNRIIKISDFQIVNGGQTAATIHYTNRKERISLDEVFVSVKITSLKKDDDYSKTVSKISLAANTQTAISTSDLYANDPYLIELEQISLKYPSRNELDRNVYFFFERMKGQYAVSKSNSGTLRQQEVWEERHPRPFMFNKIDVARWYNMMNELPYVAATGAEKQFEDFMENINFQKQSISLGRFKTLIGFGILFSRIYKLCGKANGRSYPSLTIDPQTGKHSPVAMSTAIYTMSYLHMISNGCIDYWSIFDYRYGLCNSLLSKERFDSSLDHLLEKVIISCWHRIYDFGGSASQEQSKKKACWEYVKTNLKIENEDLKILKLYQITVDEKNKRDLLVIENENESYFDSLNLLLKNNAYNLQLLTKYAELRSEYLKERQLTSNHIKKIKAKTQILTKKKINEIVSFHNKLKSLGYSFDSFNNDFNIEINLPFIEIYNNIIKNPEYINSLMKNKIETSGDVSREEDYISPNVVKEIMDKLDREYGLSIEDFEKLNTVYLFFKDNKS